VGGAEAVLCGALPHVSCFIDQPTLKLWGTVAVPQRWVVFSDLHMSRRTSSVPHPSTRQGLMLWRHLEF
jgi:hypothetical protein